MAGVVIFNIPIKISINSTKYPSKIYIDNICLQWVDWSDWGFTISLDGSINSEKIVSSKNGYYDELCDNLEEAEDYHNFINNYALKLRSLFISSGVDNFLLLIEKYLDKYENNLSQLLLDYLLDKIIL